jgi:hypothetical protein
MTPQATMAAYKEAIDILNRIQGRDKTKFFIKELFVRELKGKTNTKTEGDKKHGTGAKG